MSEQQHQRILITGATGFVGGWLAQELSAAYPGARLFGTTHGHAPAAPPPPAVTLLPCDLTVPAEVAAVVDAAEPDRVFHLAGFASAAGGDADTIRRVNVGATRTLLQTLADAGRPCRALLASSGYVYGATRPGRPAREDDPVAPAGAYAESKAEMERDVAAFRASGGDNLTLVITRSFNHTGPHQTTDFVVPAFARQLARIEAGLEPPVVRVGNLDARRDFLDVRDVVRAYRLLLCEAALADPITTVNVCSGSDIAIRALLDMLVAHASAEVSVEQDPNRMRPSDLPECVGDPARLTALTGWRPQIPIEQTLADTLGWWRTQETGNA